MLIFYSGAAQCNYLARMLPNTIIWPNLLQRGVQIFAAANRIQGWGEDTTDRERLLMGLPLSYGGFGLRVYEKIADAAFWGSWADTLGSINAWAPHMATEILEWLHREPIGVISDGLAQAKGPCETTHSLSQLGDH